MREKRAATAPEGGHMAYEGLTQDDLDNVRALNAVWLELDGRMDGVGHRLTAGCRERLAAAPFLLFSFREHDGDWWTWLLDERRQQDLLAAIPQSPDGFHGLQVAAFAFLWEMSRRNPYVARLVTGAPVDWCELIASVTLVHALERIAGHETIEARFVNDTSRLARLCRRGASALPETRRSAQLSALQAMLTRSNDKQHGGLPAAACRMAVPARRAADEL
ncbi:MAG: hypothetical protein MJA32_10160 [Proteobacteria bacterium]|nr:hypothetical protein [Pseudomonadota bacterium]